MTEWRECKLGDVITFQRGYDLPKDKMVRGIYPVVASNGIIGFHNEYTTENPCVTIGRSGNVGNPNIVYSRAWAHNTTLYIREYKNCDPVFIYYMLHTLDLGRYASGSAVPTLNRNHIHSILISMPPLPEQKAIAEVLSSLDDKIDLLTRQNKTLEDLAQAYFRKWFIEDASDEWEVGKAENYFEIGIGKTPPRKEEHWFSKNKDDVVWISISDMGKSGMFIGDSSEYLTEDAVRRFNIKRVPKGAIILSFKLTVGRVAIALREFTTNEAIAHFIYKNDYEREYLYFYLKTFDYYSLGSTSSIATAVNSKIIKDMPFIMPNIEALQKYHKIAAPIFSKIEYNTNQILTLQKLRDTLLPKLISGEIRLKM